MSEVTCYLERAGGGALIRRVRLIGDRIDRAWTIANRGEQVDAEGYLTAARSAASWVAEQLKQRKASSLRICVDAEGGLCGWASVTSVEPGAVRALLAQAGSNAGDVIFGRAIEREGELVGVLGEGRTLQALSDRPAPPGTPGRVGVLSVPDAAVCVFLDELDRLGVQADSVISIWHAAGAAWDPGRTDEPMVGAGSQDIDARVAASDAPVTGVVLVDDHGRVIWSWSRAGELIAGGSLRLAHREGRRHDDPEEVARRLGEAGPMQTEHEVTAGDEDVGRLAMDWLAWSVQLGAGPSRVVCVVAPSLGSDEAPSDAGHAGTDGARAFGAALGRLWDDATVDVVVRPDVIGATLERLGSAGEARDEAQQGTRAFRELSHRPGRVHRWFYRWTAVALVALSVLICVLGSRLASTTDDAHVLADEAASQWAALRDEAADKFDRRIRVSLTPERALRAYLDEQEKALADVPRGNVVVREAFRAMDALASVEAEDVELKRMTVSRLASKATSTITLVLPSADVGTRLVEELQRREGVLRWTGRVITARPGKVDYLLEGNEPKRTEEAAR